MSLSTALLSQDEHQYESNAITSQPQYVPHFRLPHFCDPHIAQNKGNEGCGTYSNAKSSTRRKLRVKSFNCPMCLEDTKQTILCMLCGYETCKPCATRFI